MISTLTTIIARRRHSRSHEVIVATATLGFSAAMTQLALTREIIGTFSGNELAIGITLSCWLVLTAFGTWCGSLVHSTEHPVRLLSAGTIVLSVCAILEILALRTGRDLVLLPGTAAGPFTVAAVALVAMAPFCLGSGALLTIACHELIREQHPSALGRVYAADACGSIVGAIAFTFGFASWADHAVTLCWSAVAVCLVAARLGWRRKSLVRAAIAAVAAIALGVLAVAGNLDGRSLQREYRGEIVHRAASPYGRLVVTRHSGQLTFFENGVPAIYTHNAVQIEEAVHYAMAQRPDARSVLLIGGAVAGAAKEIWRYPHVTNVTGIELDPAIIDAGWQLLPGNLTDPRLRLLATDGRNFIRHANQQFDVIIVSVPDPTTYQLNRFFTVEFFNEAKRRLTPGGVLAFGCGRLENFISPELRKLFASTHRSIAAVFKHVAVFPGGRVFFVASDEPVQRDVARRLESRGIAPVYVNRHYLDAVLTPDRLAQVDEAANAEAPLNRDSRPVLYLIRLKQWLGQFAFPTRGAAAALVIGATLCFVRFRPIPRVLFAAGFAGSALELVLLVTLQTLFGSLYQHIGVVVAAFMLGLALGASLANAGTSARPRHRVRQLAIVIVGAAMAMGLGLPWLGTASTGLGDAMGYAIILALTLVLGGAIGAQFGFAAALGATITARTAPRFLSADLVGAAIGGLAASAFLLPAWGMGPVCLLTAALNAAAWALSSSTPRDA